MNAHTLRLYETLKQALLPYGLTLSPLEGGFVKARTSDTTTEEAYNNWYQKVYLPVTTESGGSTSGGTDTEDTQSGTGSDNTQTTSSSELDLEDDLGGGI